MSSVGPDLKDTQGKGGEVISGYTFTVTLQAACRPLAGQTDVSFSAPAGFLGRHSGCRDRDT